MAYLFFRVVNKAMILFCDNVARFYGFVVLQPLVLIYQKRYTSLDQNGTQTHSTSKRSGCVFSQISSTSTSAVCLHDNRAFTNYAMPSTGWPWERLLFVVKECWTRKFSRQPFVPVNVMPSMKYRCAAKKMTSMGNMTTTVAAIIRFHSVWNVPWNCDSPSCSVNLLGSFK